MQRAYVQHLIDMGYLDDKKPIPTLGQHQPAHQPRVVNNSSTSHPETQATSPAALTSPGSRAISRLHDDYNHPKLLVTPSTPQSLATSKTLSVETASTLSAGSLTDSGLGVPSTTGVIFEDDVDCGVRFTQDGLSDLVDDTPLLDSYEDYHIEHSSSNADDGTSFITSQPALTAHAGDLSNTPDHHQAHAIPNHMSPTHVFVHPTQSDILDHASIPHCDVVHLDNEELSVPSRQQLPIPPPLAPLSSQVLLVAVASPRAPFTGQPAQSSPFTAAKRVPLTKTPTRTLQACPECRRRKRRCTHKTATGYIKAPSPKPRWSFTPYGQKSTPVALYGPKRPCPRCQKRHKACTHTGPISAGDVPDHGDTDPEKGTPVALDGADEDTPGNPNITGNPESSVSVASPDARGLHTQGDVLGVMREMRDSIMAIPGLPNITVAGLTLDRRDVDSILSPNWYTDAVIDMISQVALEETSNNTVFYQQAVAITTHIAVNQGQSALYVIAALRVLVQAARGRSPSAPRGRWPCSGLALHHTDLIFPWNPFGNHWVAVSIRKNGSISLWDSMGAANQLTLEYARLALPLYAQLVALRPGCE